MSTCGGIVETDLLAVLLKFLGRRQTELTPSVRWRRASEGAVIEIPPVLLRKISLHIIFTNLNDSIWDLESCYQSAEFSKNKQRKQLVTPYLGNDPRVEQYDPDKKFIGRQGVKAAFFSELAVKDSYLDLFATSYSRTNYRF